MPLWREEGGGDVGLRQSHKFHTHEYLWGMKGGLIKDFPLFLLRHVVPAQKEPGRELGSYLSPGP